MSTHVCTHLCVCVCVCVCVAICSFSLASPGAPSDVTITEFDRTTVTLTWTPPGSDGGRPDDLFYIIQYKTVESPVNYYSPLPRITENSVTVPNLNQVTTYQFAVIAANNIMEKNPSVFENGSCTSSGIIVTTKPSCELHTCSCRHFITCYSKVFYLQKEGISVLIP